MTLTIEQWLQKSVQEPHWLQTNDAITSIPKTTNQDSRLIAGLLAHYLRRSVPISVSWQRQFIRLMKQAFQQGHVPTGLVNRKPVWFHLLQLRLTELYSDIAMPNQPSLAIVVQLAGYFGTLVKLALAVEMKTQTVEEAIAGRQSPFDYRGVLGDVSSTQNHLSIPTLMRLIAKQPLPSIRDVDALVPYQLSIHPKLPKMKRFLIHEAVMNGHIRLARELLLRYPKLWSSRDNWNRTPLHLMKIFGVSLDEVGLSQSEIQSVEQLRDGFGRTATDVEEWKNRLVQAEDVLERPTDNGGWSTVVLKEYRGARQQVDSINYQDLSWDTFLERYASCSKPVLIRGAPNVEAMQSRWKQSRFLHHHAKMPVEVGDIPYASSLGRKGYSTTFADYWQKQKDYVFVQLHPQHHQKILSDIPKMGYFDGFPVVNTQFYQGAAGTGAPMHLHTDAWNCLVYGEKRWFLMPPFQGIYSSQPILEWVKGDMSLLTSTMLECTQRAGDILYVPKYWSHAVLNIQECIGFAKECINPYLA